MATEPKPPELGQAGESCRDCGFPLATDQRYCVNCGARRGGPRVDYLKLLAPEAGLGGATNAADGSAAGAVPRRDGSPMLAVAGIALLGLMLLVGVLIGRGGDATSQEPVVVRLGEGGTATTPAAPVAEPAKQKTKDAASTAGVKQASTAELEALANAEGEAYQEASKKLPDTIATPGEAPPKDNEKPGGGTAGTVIE